MKRVIFGILIAFGLGISVAEETAQPAPATEQAVASTQEPEEDSALSVNADSMEMSMDQNSILLEGNVLIADKTMQLTAKKMTVKLDKDNKLKDILATGGVTVRKLNGSESATGDTATYNAQTDKVILRGNCIILQGTNTARGKEVVYDRKAGTIRLQGGAISIPLKKQNGSNAIGDLLKNEKKTEPEKKQEK